MGACAQVCRLNHCCVNGRKEVEYLGALEYLWMPNCDTKQAIFKAKIPQDPSRSEQKSEHGFGTFIAVKQRL